MKNWNRMACLAWLCLAVAARAAVVTVMDTGFESGEAPSYQAGEQLHVAGGLPYTWNWAGDNVGVISANPAAVYSGAQGLDATRTSYGGSQLWWTRPGIAFPNMDSGTVEIEFAVRTTGWLDSQDSFLEIATSDIGINDFGANSTRFSWLTLKGNQRLYALDGSSEVELASGLSITDWNTVRLTINLMSSAYDVYWNDTLLGDGLAFYGSGLGSLNSLQFKEYNSGQSSGGVYLDDLNIQWSPVPEPGTLTLLVVAFLLLAASRRRMLVTTHETTLHPSAGG